MLNENAFVVGIQEVLQGFAPGTSRLLLDDGRTVEVQRDEADVLARADLLQWLGLPAVLTLGAGDTGAASVATLEIPLVARVLEISDAPDGRVIEFDRSAARHLLTPSRTALLDPLTAALEDGRLLIVQKDPYTHEILDLEPASRQLEEAMPASWLLADDQMDSAAKLGEANVLPTELTPMTRRAADNFVSRMDSTESCGLPCSNAETCIPFRYADDGCFARAQRMCTLLIDQGVIPGKIWIYAKEGGQLVHRTENHPACRVGWTWHVAPVVRDADNDGPLVLDPGLFDLAVDPVTWKNELEDPAATTVLTTHEAFIRQKNGAITRESCLGIKARDEAESYLRIYRQELRARKPPPPFACAI